MCHFYLARAILVFLLLLLLAVLGIVLLFYNCTSTDVENMFHFRSLFFDV